MFFKEDFIEWVEENPIEGLVKACEMAISHQKKIEFPNEWSEDEHELLWDASTFVDLVLKNNEIELDLSLPDVDSNIGANCKLLLEYLESVGNVLRGHATKIRIESYKNRYATALKKSFAYEFSQGDLERIQTLLNEVRAQINDSDSLEENHKARLLKRLEKLQVELHKRVSDLDRFWGLVGDAGVVLGKLGTDAKPIVDRVKEIAEITWKTQARAEELPSGSQNPMIDQDEN